MEFVKGPRGDSPEDRLLVQFQGMFAEYEKAQILERSRRGKAHRARAGSVNVLSGAPFGYRYLRKSDHAGAAYEIVGHEATLVAELFGRYTDEAASIADLARWLTEQAVPTRTGKHRWDRSVIWAMLRNPAYAGAAVFGKTVTVAESPGLNRIARRQGRTTPRAVKVVDRPRTEWVMIPVPAIVSEDTFERAQHRLADNKRYAARNTKVASLLTGMAACAGCGYAYYRTSTRTTNKRIYYYRCLGSDDYRYEGGRVCDNQPVRADYLDQVVWDHIAALLADPRLIRAEIDQRLDRARSADPATVQRTRLNQALTQATAAITRMIGAFQEQLVTIDELRARMPDLRARETGLRAQLRALDDRLADREVYLKLADDLEGFLAQLRDKTTAPTSRAADACCVCSSKTSSSDPRRSRSGTAFPPAGARPAARTTPTPTRRVTNVEVAHCVGGVISPLLANIALHVLDLAWEQDGQRLGRLIRYCDDFVVLCPTRERAEQARLLAGHTLGPLGLQLHPDKTHVVCVRDGGQGFDFLGFHHRMVESRKRRGRYWMHKWPSARAMASIRAKVRGLTAPRQVGLPLNVVVEQLNPVLRGWGAYFRQGNSSAKFGAIDSYVHERMAILASRKHHRSGFNWSDRYTLGLAGEPRDLPTRRHGALPGGECLPVNGVGKPCAGEPHARFDGGPLARPSGFLVKRRKRPAAAPRTPTHQETMIEPAAYPTARLRAHGTWPRRSILQARVS